MSINNKKVEFDLQNETLLENIENWFSQEEIDENIRNRIKNESNLMIKIKLVAIYNIQKKQLQYDLKFNKKIKSISQKYEKKSQLLQKRVNEIISADNVIQVNELQNLDEFLAPQEIAQKQQALHSSQDEAIPNYWLQVLQNSDFIANEITENDKEALKYLKSIETSKVNEGDDNFQLIFCFNTNPYFENHILRKEFQMRNADTPYGSAGTKIEWHNEDTNLTIRTQIKKQVSKQTGKTRELISKVKSDSFFHFFNDVTFDASSLLTLKQHQNSEVKNYVQKNHQEFEIARYILDEILPYSIEYYLGFKPPDTQVDQNQIQATSENEEQEYKQEEQIKIPRAQKMKKSKTMINQ